MNFIHKVQFILGFLKLLHGQNYAYKVIHIQTPIQIINVLVLKDQKCLLTC